MDLRNQCELALMRYQPSRKICRLILTCCCLGVSMDFRPVNLGEQRKTWVNSLCFVGLGMSVAQMVKYFNLRLFTNGKSAFTSRHLTITGEGRGKWTVAANIFPSNSEPNEIHREIAQMLSMRNSLAMVASGWTTSTIEQRASSSAALCCLMALVQWATI